MHVFYIAHHPNDCQTEAPEEQKKRNTGRGHIYVHVHIDSSVKRCLAQITGALQSIVTGPGLCNANGPAKKMQLAVRRGQWRALDLLCIEMQT